MVWEEKDEYNQLKEPLKLHCSLHYGVLFLFCFCFVLFYFVF